MVYNKVEHKILLFLNPLSLGKVLTVNLLTVRSGIDTSREFTLFE